MSKFWYVFLSISVLFLCSCMPWQMGTKGDLMTVYVENVVQQDGGFVAKLSASTPSVTRPATDFKAEAEAGFNYKASATNRQTQYSKLIVEKAFNNPDQFEIKFDKDGKLEIKSRESVDRKSNGLRTSSDVVVSGNSSQMTAKSVESKKLIYEFKLSKNSWETPWIERDKGANASFSFGSQVRVNINRSNGIYYQIQLYQYGLTIENDATYQLDLDAISNKKCDILAKFHIYPPDTNLQEPEYSNFILQPGQNNVSYQFKSVNSSNRARLTLYFGQIDNGTELQINGLRLYRIN